MFHFRRIKNTTPLATFPSTMHRVLFEPPFLTRLFIRPLPPTGPSMQEQKISGDSPVIICTIQMHRLVWSLWKLAPLVELEWRSYSRHLISEAGRRFRTVLVSP